MQSPKRKRIKYLNNADLLREIHTSKMSHCWVLDEKYLEYDIITDDIRNITNDFLEEGVEKRIKRLKAKTLRVIQKERNCTPKQAEAHIDIEEYVAIEQATVNDVVVRIMTTEHIPTQENNQGEEVPIRTNYKPFKHYAIDKHGGLEEVARSHWKGSLYSGEFSMTHGRLTNELGKMFEKLCHKISLQPNYRGYSFIDEMRADASFQLTKNALLFDESRITVQLNPFAYYTTIVNHAFKAVLNSEKRNREIRDDLLEESGYDPSNTRIVEYEMAMIQSYQDRLANAKLVVEKDDHGGIFDWDNAPNKDTPSSFSEMQELEDKD